MAKRVPTESLKDFRSRVNRLKKAGVIPATNLQGRTVDVSKVTPSTVVHGKTLKEYVKKFKLASEGKAAVVKLPPEKAREYSKLGYNRWRDLVEVPALPDTEVTVSKAGEIQLKEKGGVEIVHLPVEYHNIEQFLKDAKRNSRKINAMKEANERFGFSLYGSHSHEGYQDIRHLLETLSKYRSIESSIDKRNPREAKELIQNLIIIKAPKADMYEWTGKRKREEYLKGIRLTKSQKRASWPEWKKEQYKEKRRAEEKKRYAKKKGKK